MDLNIIRSIINNGKRWTTNFPMLKTNPHKYYFIQNISNIKEEDDFGDEILVNKISITNGISIIILKSNTQTTISVGDKKEWTDIIILPIEKLMTNIRKDSQPRITFKLDIDVVVKKLNIFIKDYKSAYKNTVNENLNFKKDLSDIKFNDVIKMNLGDFMKNLGIDDIRINSKNYNTIGIAPEYFVDTLKTYKNVTGNKSMIVDFMSYNDKIAIETPDGIIIQMGCAL